MVVLITEVSVLEIINDAICQRGSLNLRTPSFKNLKNPVFFIWDEIKVPFNLWLIKIMNAAFCFVFCLADPH